MRVYVCVYRTQEEHATKVAIISAERDDCKALLLATLQVCMCVCVRARAPDKSFLMLVCVCARAV